MPKKSVTKLSKSDIQKDLENAQRRHLEQSILPSIVEVDDLGPLFTSTEFAQNIKQGLEESRKLQTKTESQIRKNVKKFGNEKRFLVQTPEDEVLKGFPEVELKWMFGEKEVVVPKAAGLHLYHGWKKWREEAKADLKRNLIEDVEFGKQYVAKRQVAIASSSLSLLLLLLFFFFPQVKLNVFVWYTYILCHYMLISGTYSSGPR